ncbi:zinc transporter ZIP1-like [Dermacentor andersoni]|uniref:zinc transporter ZIP1-like n=1 Tax=Dermacentor andersoni TaxID=34620 RepID=UPI0024161BC7|nr:zinc transporter ZIP1-like [Dermacentor andersoni]
MARQLDAASVVELDASVLHRVDLRLVQIKAPQDVVFARGSNSLIHVYQAAVSLVSCFGGGVFLATCLLHLLPEARNQFNKGIVDRWENVPDFPFVEFLCIGGLLLVLIIEQVALFWKEAHSRATFNASSPFGRDTPVANYGSLQQSDSYGDGLVRGVADNTGVEDAEAEEHTMESMHGDPNSHSSLRSIVLVLSLSLHSIFEGIAIGLQPNVQLLLQILVAVSIHKSILAVTLGINLAHSRLGRCSIFTSALTFSLMAPLGMVFAILIMQADTGEAALLNGILQGLACGTFLYVTFFEVLPHEMSHTHNRLPKVLSMVLGVGTITMLLLFLPH